MINNSNVASLLSRWMLRMKNSFSIRVKKVYRANIMLLVLLVMFVSSLLWLIVAQYVQHLISVSSIFQEYYRSYYYAYGGLELGLAQSKAHGYGFEDDFLYTDLSTCDWLTNIACNTDITIKSRWNPVGDSYQDFSNCTSLYADTPAFTGAHEYYSLSAGDAIILPLFWDTSTWFNTINYNVLSDTNFYAMSPTMYVTPDNPSESYLIKVIDENLENYNTTLEPTVWSWVNDFWSALGNFDSAPDNKNYLVVANASWSVKEFCLQLDPWSELVSKYILIESIGTYGDSVASLSALKVDQLPSFLWYGTINSW